MDGWMKRCVGWTDWQMDGNGWKNQWVSGQIVGDWWMDGNWWMDGWEGFDEWIQGLMGGNVHGMVGRRVDGQTDRRMDGWMDGWTDECMHGWMDRLMDTCVGVCVDQGLIDWMVFSAPFHNISVISQRQLISSTSLLVFTSARLRFRKNPQDPVKLKPRTPGL